MSYVCWQPGWRFSLSRCGLGSFFRIAYLIPVQHDNCCLHCLSSVVSSNQEPSVDAELSHCSHCFLCIIAAIELLDYSTCGAMKAMLKIKLVTSVLTFAVSSAYAQSDLNTLITTAKKEGAINSFGMPDDWANWKDT